MKSQPIAPHLFVNKIIWAFSLLLLLIIYAYTQFPASTILLHFHLELNYQTA